MRLSLISMAEITIACKLSYHSDYRIIGVSRDRGFTVVAFPPAIWPHARQDLGILAHLGPIDITE